MLRFYPFIASTELISSDSISFNIFSIPFFKVKVEEVRSTLTQQIESKQQQEIQKSQLSAFHSSLKICLTSLLLASCYLTIGWSGFRDKSRRVP